MQRHRRREIIKCEVTELHLLLARTSTRLRVSVESREYSEYRHLRLIYKTHCTGIRSTYFLRNLLGASVFHLEELFLFNFSVNDVGSRFGMEFLPDLADRHLIRILIALRLKKGVFDCRGVNQNL